jgi:hypothetical protein
MYSNRNRSTFTAYLAIYVQLRLTLKTGFCIHCIYCFRQVLTKKIVIPLQLPSFPFGFSNEILLLSVTYELKVDM